MKSKTLEQRFQELCVNKSEEFSHQIYNVNFMKYRKTDKAWGEPTSDYVNDIFDFIIEDCRKKNKDLSLVEIYVPETF